MSVAKRRGGIVRSGGQMNDEALKLLLEVIEDRHNANWTLGTDLVDRIDALLTQSKAAPDSGRGGEVNMKPDDVVELTREQIEAFRRNAKVAFPGMRVDQICNLALLALSLREQREGWIPVSERLPEKIGRYVCLMDGEAVTLRMGPYADWSDITYWMPLPAPPASPAGEDNA